MKAFKIHLNHSINVLFVDRSFRFERLVDKSLIKNMPAGLTLRFKSVSVKSSLNSVKVKAS